MKTWDKRDFSAGWLPAADANNGPKNCLLRMDNLELNQLGAPVLRRGAGRLFENANSFNGMDAHSLYSKKMRIAGADRDVVMAGVLNTVHSNFWQSAETNIGTNNILQQVGLSGFPGDLSGPEPDLIFGSYLDHIFVTRGGTPAAWPVGSISHFKFDAQEFLNWGIRAPLAAPTVAAVEPEFKILADCGDPETDGLGLFVSNEGTQSLSANNRDGGAESLEIIADTGTNRGTSTRTLSSAQNYNVFLNSVAGTADDVIEMYVYVSEPNNLTDVTLMIDVENGDFTQDYYFYTWRAADTVETVVTIPRILEHDYSAEGYERDAVFDRLEYRRVPTTTFRQDLASWNYLSVPRGKMNRVGSTTTQTANWTTVKAIRVTFNGEGALTLRFDDIRIVGGGAKPLKGDYVYRYRYVRDNGTYVAKSPRSSASSEITLDHRAARVAVTASPDQQVTEIWLYRMGGTMDGFYRVATAANSTGDIYDTTSDEDALVLNEFLENDITGPPDDIVGIADPIYDRLPCLTRTHLYFSMVRNPDSFRSGHAVRIGDDAESCYWIKKAFGGHFVGTSRDIYRIDGDGSEYPDGTINLRKVAMNIDYPPVGRAVASEGNYIVYLASDGWRQFNGANSTNISEDLRPLFFAYSGQTTHGLARIAIRNSAARFRCALSRGQFFALTPDDDDWRDATTGLSATKTVMRYDFALKHWYRHTYQWSFRSIATHADGSIMLGATNGFIYRLDASQLDDGANIPVVIWTTVDDDGTPLERKTAQDYSYMLDTGGFQATIGFYLDNSGAASGTLTPQLFGPAFDIKSITLSSFYSIQTRITGAFPSFQFQWGSLKYLERARATVYFENKPIAQSPRRRRFSGLTVSANTKGVNATVTPVLDGVDQTTATFNSSEPVVKALTFASVVGRDLWGRLTMATGAAEVYAIDPIVIEELPQVFRGRINDSNFGWAGEKVLTGLSFRVCTLNASRTFTPILDDVNQTTFALTTELDEPDTYIHKFTAAQTATDIAFSVDGDIELYEFKPIIQYKLPMKRRVWDTGQIDLGAGCGFAWVRELCIKAEAAANLTVTPYIDEVAQTASTVTVTAGVTRVYSVERARELKGRQFQIIITSASDFSPYWAEFLYRVSGQSSQKQTRRISAQEIVS